MSVYIYEGLPGNGKTLHITSQLFEDLKRGKHCYTNIDLDLAPFERFRPYQIVLKGKLRDLYQYFGYKHGFFFNCCNNFIDWFFPRVLPLQEYYHRIYDIDDLKELSYGQVYIDEIHLYFDARDWDKTDAEQRRVLAQHRHFGLNIYGTTQAMTRVENILRQLTEVAYSIKKIIVFHVPFTNMTWGFFFIRSFMPKTLLDSDGSGTEWNQVGWGRIWIADPILFRLYDTFQNIKRPVLVGTQELVTYTYIEKPQITKVAVSRQKLPSV